MTTYSSGPTNKSFLSNNKYEFVIDRLPHVKFFLQSITLPDISLNGAQVPNPYVLVNLPNNTLNFSELTLTYIMDEEMRSWKEIYDWITNLGNPEGLNKLGTLTREAGRSNSITSDASLLVKSNANNPLIKFTFRDIFPSTLTGVTFSSVDSQEFLTGTIIFLYTHYTVEYI